MKDPYQILGVPSDASQDQIKSSFRKLAKKFHPDLNPGNKEAEQKFKEIQHAFDLIGTVEARGKWDRGETDEQKQQQYEEYARHQQNRSRQKPFYHETQDQGGRYTYHFGDEMGDDDIFARFFGRGQDQQFNIRGEDALYHLDISFLEAAKGAERVITLPGGKRLQVKIPSGIQDGQKLKFKGLGSPGIGKAPPGDAYVQISILPSTDYRREGQDILSEIPISLFEAVTGAEVQVNTIDGPVMLKVPPGVTTGSRLRIRGKGAGAGDTRGNHIVEIKVMTPKSPDVEFQKELRELKVKYDYNPREER